MGRMILFSCRLPVEQSNRTRNVCIERVGGTTISKEDCDRIVDVVNPSIRTRELANRFAAGSELWLAKVDGKLAGFGWTINAKTIEPYFFPLQRDDVHLFDFYVFPEFRGRGINAAIIMDILHKLGTEKVCRAHIESAAWNNAQLCSLKKTAFCQYAVATKVRLFGRSLVLWH